ncbi:MAG: cation:proton antiporter [Candidatus Omnitrophica bacterium]|nr:cation:proton antiporter [Candidatus Omnitrophota bacterium]
MNINLLLLTGISIFLGTFGGKLFKKLKIPQVVGYIVVGVILGQSGLRILNAQTIEMFTPLINIALGIIGFRIGAELKGEVFKKYGRSIYMILFGEGMLAFIVVTAVVTLVTKKLHLGLLLGAIASATAPAATTDVLWEYKARGPLTTTLFAIVALDDALALIIYGFASVFAKSMMAHSDFSLFQSVLMPIFDLSMSCLIGACAGFALSALLRKIKDKELMFSFSLAFIIFTVGLAIFFKLDFILSAMTLGAVFTNIAPQISKKVFDTIESFSPPIYVMFFILVGARLQAKLFLNLSITSLAIVYLFGRTFGKMAGAYLGAWLSKAQKSVRKYLGMCLFSQAGVAIGLAMVVYHNFSLLGPEGKEIGLLVLNIVTATTFVVQLIGPACVKIAITKADEAWRNVTEEDIIDSSTVADFMRKDFNFVKENAGLDKIMQTIKERESYHFPVVNNQGELTGLISLGNLKNVFGEEQLDNIILARDLAEPVRIILYPDQPLREAFDIFEKRELEYLPVVKNATSKEIVGIVEYFPLIESVNIRTMERQESLEKNTIK